MGVLLWLTNLGKRAGSVALEIWHLCVDEFVGCALCMSMLWYCVHSVSATLRHLY